MQHPPRNFLHFLSGGDIYFSICEEDESFDHRARSRCRTQLRALGAKTAALRAAAAGPRACNSSWARVLLCWRPDGHVAGLESATSHEGA